MSADSEVVAQGEDNQEEQYRAEKRVKKRDCMCIPVGISEGNKTAARTHRRPTSYVRWLFPAHCLIALRA